MHRPDSHQPRRSHVPPALHRQSLALTPPQVCATPYAGHVCGKRRKCQESNYDSSEHEPCDNQKVPEARPVAEDSVDNLKPGGRDVALEPRSPPLTSPRGTVSYRSVGGHLAGKVRDRFVSYRHCCGTSSLFDPS